MAGLRYIAWDGTQALRLDPDALFEELARSLSQTDDTQAALDMMLRDGIDMEGLQVMGLDELRELLAEERRRLSEGVNLDRSLDEMREKLAEALREEREAIANAQEGDDDSLSRERRAMLDDLGDRLSSAIETLLQRHQFSSEEAQAKVGELASALDSIRRIEDAQERMGRSLNGDRSLTFEEALELANNIEFGLTSSIFTQDISRAFQFLERTQ